MCHSVTHSHSLSLVNSIRAPTPSLCVTVSDSLSTVTMNTEWEHQIWNQGKSWTAHVNTQAIWNWEWSTITVLDYYTITSLSVTVTKMFISTFSRVFCTSGAHCHWLASTINNYIYNILMVTAFFFLFFLMSELNAIAKSSLNPVKWDF